LRARVSTPRADSAAIAAGALSATPRASVCARVFQIGSVF
jgi:hypothetical protein